MPLTLQTIRDVHKSFTWSLSQVWSLWPGVRVKSEVFIAGVWVKSQVFGHESESSLKSFNGSLKKSHSESSCIEIFLFMKLFYMV